MVRALDGVLPERHHPVVAMDLAGPDDGPGVRLVGDLPH
jgi:hypothetical protein